MIFSIYQPTFTRDHLLPASVTPEPSSDAVRPTDY